MFYSTDAYCKLISNVFHIMESVTVITVYCHESRHAVAADLPWPCHSGLANGLFKNFKVSCSRDQIMHTEYKCSIYHDYQWK